MAGPLRGRSPDASAHHLVFPKTTLILAPVFASDLRAQAVLDASEKLAVAAKLVAKRSRALGHPDDAGNEMSNMTAALGVRAVTQLSQYCRYSPKKQKARL